MVGPGEGPDDPPGSAPVRARAALAVAAVAILGGSVYLVLDAFTGDSTTFRFVDEVAREGASLRGRPIKVAGSLVPASLAPAGPGRRTFVLEKNGARLRVVADERLLPEGLDVPGRDVVVDGTIDASGVLRATLVTTGCPSRYESKRR
jgi:cytochrome c-type biogenesis protein CcmE